jgi:type IV pilus assembly protein PilB
MSIKQSALKKLIEKEKLVSSADLATAQNVASHLGCQITDVLLGRDLIDEESLGLLLAKHYKVDYVDLNKTEVDLNALKLIPEDVAVQRGVVAFEKNNGKLFVAMEDPKDLELTETVKKVIGNGIKITPYYATSSGIKNALKLYKSRQGIDGEAVNVVKMDETSAVAAVDKLLEEAIREEASDIHFEPLEDNLLVRFRVDGVLHDAKLFVKEMHPAIVARIKILSDLKLDETRLPQDGQFSVMTRRNNNKTSFRVSVTPTVYGEKVVLRLLESTLTKFNLEELGLLPEDQEVASKVLERTHGMLLVTGPTGSGKTTTLYTVLGLLNKPDVNIFTIEDPVENRIKRVNQMQVNAQIDLSFASGLRSVLRQDPDVVMVGEIRDKETAVIATNAAMTGHLVFSTVHANTSAGAIPRMVDLGVEPFLLASTLNMVIAQRLVRVLCPRCKEETAIDPIMQKKLDDLKKRISPEIAKMVRKNHASVGCHSCYGTGFRGRIGIFELLAVDESIKELVVNKATSNVIWDVARKKGAKTMLEDGLIKVAKGETTLEEVFRVISE